MLDGQPLGEYPELSPRVDPLQWLDATEMIRRRNSRERLRALGDYIHGEHFYGYAPHC